MPKPMLNKPDFENRSANILSAVGAEVQNSNTQQMSKMKLDKLLRKSRSKEYLERLHGLDAGGHMHNKSAVADLIDIIRNEFPEVEIEKILLGVVSECYLGDPYEVHSLDITGQILTHYKRGEAMPGGLEKARAVAIRGGYELIEVYVDCLRCISGNGSVSVIPNA